MREREGPGLRGQAALLQVREVVDTVYPVFSAAENHALLHRTTYTIWRDGEPRWILPGKPRLVLDVLRSWRPASLESRIRWDAILLACKLGVLSRMPGVSRESTAADLSYWRQWLAGYSDAWQLVIYLGKDSHTRKITIFFVDEAGGIRAVAKVPIYEATATAILNEADLLRRVQAKLTVPEVLFADEEHGIAAQSWVQGKSVGRPLREQHIKLLSRLVNQGQTVRLCDYRDPLAASAAELDLPLEAAVLQRCFAMLQSTNSLPAFVEHRDFTPWNLRALPDGSLTLIDWEWGVESSLPWQDVCHFFYIQNYLFKESRNIWEILTTNPLLEAYRRQFGIPAADLPGLTLHYLLRTLCLDWGHREHQRAQYIVTQIHALLAVQN